MWPAMEFNTCVSNAELTENEVTKKKFKKFIFEQCLYNNNQ